VCMCAWWRCVCVVCASTHVTIAEHAAGASVHHTRRVQPAARARDCGARAIGVAGACVFAHVCDCCDICVCAQQRRKLGARDAFRLFDHDRDGYLSKEELYGCVICTCALCRRCDVCCALCHVHCVRCHLLCSLQRPRVARHACVAQRPARAHAHHRPQSARVRACACAHKCAPHRTKARFPSTSSSWRWAVPSTSTTAWTAPTHCLLSVAGVCDVVCDRACAC
jgi:hypothetical protein